jgi:DNA-binding transcriptional LysR family regulator
VTGRDGLSMIRADQVDFAIGSMLEVPDDIRYEPIVTYYPALITAKDHPLALKENITLRDISEYGLILPPRHLSTWRIVELVFQQHNLKFKVSLEAGGWEVIKKYVQLGLGISIVTDVCLTAHDDLAVKPLGKYFPTRSYGIVSRRGKFLSPAAVRYIDMLREYYADKDPAEISRCANC